MGGAKSEGDAREGRAASGREEEEEAKSWSYRDTVLSGNIRQAVCQETDRKGGGFLLPDDQCTKIKRPVTVFL